jgi:hypothetical protein
MELRAGKWEVQQRCVRVTCCGVPCCCSCCCTHRRTHRGHDVQRLQHARVPRARKRRWHGWRRGAVAAWRRLRHGMAGAVFPDQRAHAATQVSRWCTHVAAQAQSAEMAASPRARRVKTVHTRVRGVSGCELSLVKTSPMMTDVSMCVGVAGWWRQARQHQHGQIKVSQRQPVVRLLPVTQLIVPVLWIIQQPQQEPQQEQVGGCAAVWCVGAACCCCCGCAAALALMVTAPAA